MAFQNIKKVEWKEIRDRVFAANPEIAKEIDAIPVSEHSNLYLGAYPFGSRLIENGLTYIPVDNQFRATTDPSLPNELAQDLGYANVPMLMCLNKSAELFLDFDQRTYPLHFFYPGQILGLWPILDTHHSASVYHEGKWSLAIGARTIFMLPKVMDYGNHSKMQRQLQLEDAYPPRSLFDQGLVFADIAASSKINCDWSSEIIFFSKGWAEALKVNKWPSLHHALLQREWNDTLFLRNHMSIEIIWQVLAQAQAQTRLKPNTYVIETVKHLINIAVNASPGFAPLTENDEVIAPVKTLQNAYIEYYQLKQYIPTLFAPAYLYDHGAIYYSFLCPTLLSLSPNHNFRNTLEDERNIKHILELFLEELSQYEGYQKILSRDLTFDFFHFEADDVYNILPVTDLPKIDPQLNKFAQDPERVFSDNAPFLRSCLRIQRSSSIR